MLTRSDSGAVVFALQQIVGRIHYLDTEQIILESFDSIPFLLNCLRVHHDTVRYFGMYQMTLYEGKKNALAMPEQLRKISFW